MDSHGWRRELDKFAELKGILVSVNPAMEEQSNRQVRHLYDIFANLSKFENDLTTSGFMKKGKIKKEVEKTRRKNCNYKTKRKVIWKSSC